MRKYVAAVALGLAALAGRRCLTFRESMSKAAPELRNPAVLITGIPMRALTLPLIRALMGWQSQIEPGVTLTKNRIGDNALEVFVLTPADQSGPRPAVLLLHGGGMCAGSAQLESRPAAQLARALGAVAVLPNYRLAPEHPFPAGLDDCMATLWWMVKNADELGIDADRIAACGTSAGGGLAASVAQRATDEGIRLRAQALISPMLDDRTALREDLAGRGELTWSPKSNRWAWTAYLGREPRWAEAPQYASPSRRADVAGLPPAWIGVGDLEVFHDECVDYAQRLEAAGVACELVTVRGMYHTAEGINPNAPSMKQFHASMVDFLRVHLDAAA
jgi:acetyl esterase/lipase